MKCAKCETVIEDGSKFCPICGTPVVQEPVKNEPDNPVFCQKCGTELFIDDSFCPSCGCPVNGAGVSKTYSGSYIAHDEGSRVDPIYDSTLYDSSHLYKAPAKEKNNNTLIIVIIITAVALLIAGAAIFFILDPFGLFGGGDYNGSNTTAVTETARDSEKSKEKSSSGKTERSTPRPTARPTERPDGDSLQTSSGYNYIVDERFIDMSDVRGMDQMLTRRLINEMYARHGYIFKDKDIQRYFDNQSWYYGNTRSQDEVKDRFNIYEEENLKILIKYEEEMGWR